MILDPFTGVYTAPLHARALTAVILRPKRALSFEVLDCKDVYTHKSEYGNGRYVSICRSQHFYDNQQRWKGTKILIQYVGSCPEFTEVYIPSCTLSFANQIPAPWELDWWQTGNRLHRRGFPKRPAHVFLSLQSIKCQIASMVNVSKTTSKIVSLKIVESVMVGEKILTIWSTVLNLLNEFERIGLEGQRVIIKLWDLRDWVTSEIHARMLQLCRREVA